MAKRFSTTQIDQPVKKWNVRLEAPAVYVVAGVSPNKVKFNQHGFIKNVFHVSVISAPGQY
jgi:hypothetical protein